MGLEVGILRQGGGSRVQRPTNLLSLGKAQPNQGNVGWPEARNFVTIQRPP